VSPADRHRRQRPEPGCGPGGHRHGGPALPAVRIDRLINRTLAYGLLSLLLGAGYAAVALVLGQLAGRDSSLAVATQTVEPTKASLWLRDAGRR